MAPVCTRASAMLGQVPGQEIDGVLLQEENSSCLCVDLLNGGPCAQNQRCYEDLTMCNDVYVSPSHLSWKTRSASEGSSMHMDVVLKSLQPSVLQATAPPSMHILFLALCQLGASRWNAEGPPPHSWGWKPRGSISGARSLCAAATRKREVSGRIGMC